MTVPSVPLPTIRQPVSPAAEAFRALRNTIRFQAEAHAQKTLLVTSAGPQEGKSLVSANLASALAQMGLQVTLVDANLRTPSLHTALGVSQAPGLADHLSDTGSVPQLHENCGAEGLSLLTAGAVPENAPELLASHRMADVVAELARRSDHVILDTPPLLLAADAAAMARCVDGVILVVRANQTRRNQVQRAKTMLSQVGAHALGIVFNDDPNAAKSLIG